MKTSSKQSMPPATASKRPRLWLTLFAAMVLGIAGLFLATGLAQRQEIRDKGGPVSVEVQNVSGLRLRADIWIGQQLTTLEMDPEEGGVIRYSPKEPSPLQLIVYRKNIEQAMIEYSRFEPEKERHVTVELLSKTNVKFLEK